MNDIEYMKIALKEARIAYELDEVPVGAILVKNDEIIAKGHNSKELYQDVLRHAEINVIIEAERKLNSWHLEDTTLYVTLEPCMMCTGAIIHSRISKVVFGTRDPKGGALVSNIKLSEIKGINHYPLIEEGVLRDECSLILKDYFKAKRAKDK